MNRPDTSALDDWADPDAIVDAAASVRSDGAAYGGVAARVEPVWGDLSGHFHLSSASDATIYRVGAVVTDYGDAVKTGADNLAKCLEDCAGSLRQLERQRTDLISRATAARTQMADHPEPTLNDDGTLPDSFFTDQQLHQSAETTVQGLELEILQLASRYRSLMSSTASDIDAIHDDGNKVPAWLSVGIDAGLIAVAVFIPPAGGAALVASGVKTAYTEYQSRKNQLESEHPELSDSEIDRDAVGRAAWATAPGVALPWGAGKVGGKIVGKLTPNEVQQRTGSGVTSWVTGSGVSQAGSGWQGFFPASPGAPPSGRGFTPPTPRGVPPITAPPRGSSQKAQDDAAAKKAGAQTPATSGSLNDPKRMLETKDYDRDGYTDREYRPGARRDVSPPHSGVKITVPAVPPKRLVLPNFCWPGDD